MYPLIGEPLYPELWRGCVGAWAPCLGPTGLTLRDWSGYANHGTLTNMQSPSAWAAVQGRNALVFDGTNDFVTTQNVTRTENFSVSCWARVNYAASTSFARIVEHGLNTSFTLCLNKSVAANKYTAQYNDSSGGWLTSTTDVSYNWTHLCMTYHAGSATGRLYVNGREEATSTKSGTATRTLPVFIGGESTAASLTSLAGEIAEARVYNRTLIANEVQTLSIAIGIAFSTSPRRRARSAAFKAYWAARKAQIIGGGL